MLALHKHLTRTHLARIVLSLAQQSSPVLSSLQDCSATPLFGRKDNKATALLDLDGKENALAQRRTAIEKTGMRIQEMVKVRMALEHCMAHRHMRKGLPAMSGADAFAGCSLTNAGWFSRGRRTQLCSRLTCPRRRGWPMWDT